MVNFQTLWFYENEKYTTKHILQALESKFKNIPEISTKQFIEIVSEKGHVTEKREQRMLCDEFYGDQDGTVFWEDFAQTLQESNDAYYTKNAIV